MTKHTVISIGRQFGSGGHDIGNRLAGRLDLPLYDHNLIRMAAGELKISMEDAARVDESLLGKYRSALITDPTDYITFMSGKMFEESLTDQVYEKQSALIQKLAQRGPAIFVGRCSDYVLGDYSNCNNVFIYAYNEDRIRRIMELYKLDERKAWEKIKRVDRGRKAYYEEHTGREWGGIEAHQMMFNASLLGIDGVVDALESVYKKWDSGCAN